jgi:hypothetical protein
MSKEEKLSFEEYLEISKQNAVKEVDNLIDLPKASGLHESIINVMKAVKNIDKSMTVGSGQNSYKGVADKDVKYIIGSAMAENNLTCLPIDIQPKVQIDRWEASETYNGDTQLKQKQSVFTEVIAKFLITHSFTGENITIVGYGHGVDAQDKSAGKATTYALKNALLYSFLVPTGEIDDTDKTHSSTIEVPKTVKQPISNERFEKAIIAVNDGKAKKEDLFKFELTDLQKSALQLL